jgi:hypothetical protein
MATIQIPRTSDGEKQQLIARLERARAKALRLNSPTSAGFAEQYLETIQEGPISFALSRHWAVQTCERIEGMGL